MISILLGATYLGFMQKLDIDIMKNMELVYSGENGNAILRVRNSSKAIDQRVDALIDTVKYQASPNSGLSNGDTVHIVASYDKEVAKQYKFRIKETTGPYVYQFQNCTDMMDAAERLCMAGITCPKAKLLRFGGKSLFWPVITMPTVQLGSFVEISLIS